MWVKQKDATGCIMGNEGFIVYGGGAPSAASILIIFSCVCQLYRRAVLTPGVLPLLISLNLHDGKILPFFFLLCNCRSHIPALLLKWKIDGAINKLMPTFHLFSFTPYFHP